MDVCFYILINVWQKDKKRGYQRTFFERIFNIKPVDGRGGKHDSTFKSNLTKFIQNKDGSEKFWTEKMHISDFDVSKDDTRFLSEVKVSLGNIIKSEETQVKSKEALGSILKNQDYITNMINVAASDELFQPLMTEDFKGLPERIAKKTVTPDEYVSFWFTLIAFCLRNHDNHPDGNPAELYGKHSQIMEILYDGNYIENGPETLRSKVISGLHDYVDGILEQELRERNYEDASSVERLSYTFKEETFNDLTMLVKNKLLSTNVPYLYMTGSRYINKTIAVLKMCQELDDIPVCYISAKKYNKRVLIRTSIRLQLGRLLEADNEHYLLELGRILSKDTAAPQLLVIVDDIPDKGDVVLNRLRESIMQARAKIPFMQFLLVVPFKNEVVCNAGADVIIASGPHVKKASREINPYTIENPLERFAIGCFLPYLYKKISAGEIIKNLDNSTRALLTLQFFSEEFVGVLYSMQNPFEQLGLSSKQQKDLLELLYLPEDDMPEYVGNLNLMLEGRDYKKIPGLAYYQVRNKYRTEIFFEILSNIYGK